MNPQKGLPGVSLTQRWPKALDSYSFLQPNTSAALLACWLMPSFSPVSSYSLHPHCLSVTKQRGKGNICKHTHPSQF